MPRAPRKQKSQYAVEYPKGLKRFAVAELKRRFPKAAEMTAVQDEELRLGFDGSPRELLALRVCTAVSRVVEFDVPRPQALLGDLHFRRLLEQVEALRPLAQPARSFRFKAAGDDSAVFKRLAERIEGESDLRFDPDNGEIVLRIVRSGAGWAVLIRLGARPLGTRTWRVVDYPGALNGCIAAAMCAITKPSKDDRVLNLMCGSGTLLIERALMGPAARLAGIDDHAPALDAARRNASAAKVSLEVSRAEVRELPFKDGSFDVVLADLPYGERHGKRSELVDLYRSALEEAVRTAAPDARLVFITQATDQFRVCLDELRTSLELVESFKVFQGGYHPEIFVLRKQSAQARPKKSA